MSKVNILYSEKTIRLAGFDDRGKISVIDEVDYIDSRIFFLEPKIDKNRISEFSSLILNLFRKNNINNNTANLLLDSRLADLFFIPLDFNDEIENVNSSLIWEISNIYPENYKNYKITYQKINENDNNFRKFGNTLIIIYHKNISEILKRVSEINNILFSKMNFDLFASAEFIQYFHNDFILINSKKNKTDIGFYLKKSLRFMKTFYYSEIENTSFDEELKTLLCITEFCHLKNVFLSGGKDVPYLANLLSGLFPEKNNILLDPFNMLQIEKIPTDLKISRYSYSPLFIK